MTTDLIVIVISLALSLVVFLIYLAVSRLYKDRQWKRADPNLPVQFWLIVLIDLSELSGKDEYFLRNIKVGETTLGNLRKAGFPPFVIPPECHSHNPVVLSEYKGSTFPYPLDFFLRHFSDCPIVTPQEFEQQLRQLKIEVSFYKKMLENIQANL